MNLLYMSATWDRILVNYETRFKQTMACCAALFFRLKAKAFKTCKLQAEAYAACCEGRSFSTVWACREKLKDLSACLGNQ